MRSILLKKKEKRKKDPQPRNARVFPLWLSANRITVGRNTLTFKCNNRSGWAKTQRMSPTYWSTWRNLASQSPIGSCVRLRLPPSPRPPFYFELQIIESEPVLVLFFPFPSRFLPMIHLQYSIRWRFGILFFSSFGSFGFSFFFSFFLSLFIYSFLINENGSSKLTYDFCVAFTTSGDESHLTLFQRTIPKTDESHLESHQQIIESAWHRNRRTKQ